MTVNGEPSLIVGDTGSAGGWIFFEGFIEPFKVLVPFLRSTSLYYPNLQERPDLRGNRMLNDDKPRC
jgi:hypothetical protein